MQGGIDRWSIAHFKLHCQQHKNCKVCPACIFCSMYFKTAPAKWEEVDTTEEENKQNKRKEKMKQCKKSQKQS